MDLDPTLRGGLELGLKICPVKTSTGHCGAYRITSDARCWCYLRRRLSVAWALRYSITSGARNYCHLGRKISVAWAMRYSITFWFGLVRIRPFSSATRGEVKGVS